MPAFVLKVLEEEVIGFGMAAQGGILRMAGALVISPQCG